MKRYTEHMLTALVCFLLVVILNFALPRMLPGDPVAYLTGFDEEEMQEDRYAYYRNALHLDESLPVQFRYYIASLLDGSLGYSYKKEARVWDLIKTRMGASLQISLPAAVLSLALGLVWGLSCGYRKGKAGDRISTGGLLILNALPEFAAALILLILFAFKWPLFPYAGLSSGMTEGGSFAFLADRIHHLILPWLALILATLPSRYLMVRSSTAAFAGDKSVQYARQRGLSNRTIKYRYILKNIAQPYITMAGTAIGTCFSGSLVIESIFSVKGVGDLLNEGVYALDYPLLQGVLFVSTACMVVCILISDLVCILIDPKVRKQVTP